MNDLDGTELFVTVKTNDSDSYYVVPIDDAVNAFECELENHLLMEGPGVTLTFEITEMSIREYLAIPKYEGPVNRGGREPEIPTPPGLHEIGLTRTGNW